MNDGGPAFPLHLGNGNNLGMSLRDYFAAKAMQGYIEGHFAMRTAFLKGSSDQTFDQWLARASYDTADAMLAARLSTTTQ